MGLSKIKIFLAKGAKREKKLRAQRAEEQLTIIRELCAFLGELCVKLSFRTSSYNN